MAKKSILIDQKYHKDLVNLSKTFGTSISGLTESMISYFRKSGINPNEAINQSPSEQIKKLDNRIVSFLKVQERDILKPMRNDVFNYQKDTSEKSALLMDQMKKILQKVFELDKQRTQLFVSEDEKIIKALIKISEAIQTKNSSNLLSSIKSIFNAD